MITHQILFTPTLLSFTYPTLPYPNASRPDTSFAGFFNPLKSIRYILCVQYKWMIIKAIISALLTALLVLFIYASPGYLVKKILGA